MLKSLRNLVLNGVGITNKNSNKLVCLCRLTTNSPALLAKSSDSKKTEDEKDEDDVFGYSKSGPARARMLERFGIVKPYAKWPQYNRIVYEPTTDGKPAKNPVILFFFYKNS